MPGIANWRELFDLEYRQLFEEGYPVGDQPEPDWPSPYLPLADPAQKKAEIPEKDWEKAYQNLWGRRASGIRPGFPFVEPNDYAEIIAAATNPPATLRLDSAEYEERILGAWFGRCAGVV